MAVADGAREMFQRETPGWLVPERPPPRQAVSKPPQRPGQVPYLIATMSAAGGSAELHVHRMTAIDRQLPRRSVDFELILVNCRQGEERLRRRAVRKSQLQECGVAFRPPRADVTARLDHVGVEKKPHQIDVMGREIEQYSAPHRTACLP